MITSSSVLLSILQTCMTPEIDKQKQSVRNAPSRKSAFTRHEIAGRQCVKPNFEMEGDINWKGVKNQKSLRGSEGRDDPEM